MNKQHKAVILGSNYFIGLSIVRCLGRQGIHCVAMDHDFKTAYVFKSKYVSESHIMPHYDKEPEAALAFLVEYAKKQSDKPVLFPCADNYVAFMDKYFETLKEYYLFPQTQKGLFTEVMEKNTLHALALKHGMRVPETLDAHDPEILSKTEGRYPWIIKPVDSPVFSKTFYVKSFLVNDDKELLEGVKKANDAGLEIIIQRVIPGFDDHVLTYDAYMDQNSEVTHEMECNKLRQYPINFGASTFTIQKHIPQLSEPSRAFFKAIGFKGFAEIEYKRDAKTGLIYMIEINVRTTTLTPMLDKAGINFPYVQYCDCIGEPLPPVSITHDTNIAFWFEVEDLYASRAYMKTKQLKLRDILKTFRRPVVPAVFDWNDLRPFFAMSSLWLKRIFRRFKRGLT